MTAVDRDQLHWALNEVARIPARPRSTLPAATRTSIVRSDGILTVRRHVDGVDCKVDIANSGPDGASCPSARSLRQLVAAVDADTVDVTVPPDGGDLVLATADGRWTLRSTPVDDFPPVPVVPAEGDLLGPTDLKGSTVAAIRRAASSASTDDARPILTGVHVAGGTAAATDGYRLTACDVGDDLAGVDVLLPWPSMRRAVRVDDGWTARFAPGRTTWSRHEVTWSFPTIPFAGDGGGVAYPDWRAVFPADLGAAVSFPRLPVVAALRRLRAVLNGSRPHPIGVRMSGGSMTVFADDGDGGQERIPDARVADGVDVQVLFNPRYLIDALLALDGDVATMHPSSGLKPVVFIEPGVRSMLMPVRA